MNEKTLNQIATLATAFAGLALLTWWFAHNPVRDFAESLPGRDGRPEGFVSRGEDVTLGSLFASFDGEPAATAGSWPRFRGPGADNISRERVPLAVDWGTAGPPLLWSVDLGEGHAGPVVADGRVYVLDYDEQQRADILRCFSFEDGREIWRRGYGIFVKRNHGMSRTVPAVAGGNVLTMGPMCHVMCVDAASGDFKWGIDLVRDYGAEVPLWYTGQCPLIDGNRAVIAVGGEALLLALDIETGEVAWKVPNPKKWKMSHSSVMPFTIFGKKMYVYAALGGIVGVSAEAEDAGRVLFESTLWNHNVIAPSPVNLGDGRIFLTAGYGSGSRMIRLRPENGSYAVESLQAITPEEGLASEQQTPLFTKGHLFAILPKDAGPLRNQFVCVAPDDLRTIVWSSGKTNRFGLGPYLVADDKFLILSDDGILTLLETSLDGYVELARAKVLDGVDAWGPMALAGGRLLARDSRRLVCLDLRARPGSEP